MHVPSGRPVTFIPPPPGTESNFVDPPNQISSGIALHTVCHFFVICCIVIRLYTRRFISREIGLDDYCCVLAYALTIVFSALLLVGNVRGLGRHLWDIPAPQVPDALKMLTIAQFINLPLVAIIKLSCLLSYWRIFKPSPKMRWILGAAISLLIGTYIGLFFATLFGCSPIKKYWDPTILRGHCLAPKSLPYASGAINVVSDLCVLAIPMPAVWSLNMKSRRKLRVIAIFSVAAFAVVASIIRLAKTPVLYVDRDRTWNLGKIEIWAVLEVNVGLICACSLAFPAFIDRYKGPLATRLRSYMSFMRTTTSSHTPKNAERSGPCIQAPASATYKKGLVLNESYSKLSGDSGGYPMSDFTSSEAVDSSQHMTRRADIEYKGGDQLVYPEEAYSPRQGV